MVKWLSYDMFEKESHYYVPNNNIRYESFDFEAKCDESVKLN